MWSVGHSYPALAKVPPNLFGIGVVRINGNVHAIGDSEHEFTIMSVSKPFWFALVDQASVGAQAIFDSGNGPDHDVVGAFWGRPRIVF